MKDVQVTLVVVYHNEKENLPCLLESFENELAGGWGSHFQFLFIDNHSTDHCSELVEKWLKSHPEIKGKNQIRLENHMAEARQQALDEVTSPWLAFVDADSRLMPGWFEKLLESIDKASAQTAVIGGKSHYRVEKDWHRFVIPLANHFPMGKRKNQKTKLPHVPTNGYLLKKQAACQVGGFDPFFSQVGEDLDINVRLRKRYEIFYDPQFCVEHKLPASIWSWCYKMALYGRAQSFVFVKHLGEIPIEKFFPLAMVSLVSFLLFCFPKTLILLILCLWIPRCRFYLLTFAFYGFGEWVGLIVALLRFFRQSKKS